MLNVAQRTALSSLTLVVTWAMSCTPPDRADVRPATTTQTAVRPQPPAPTPAPTQARTAPEAAPAPPAPLPEELAAAKAPLDLPAVGTIGVESDGDEAAATAAPTPMPLLVDDARGDGWAPPLAVTADEEAPAEVPDSPDEAETAPADGPRLVATLKETWVYAAPDFRSRKLGYLRAGAIVPRHEKPTARGGCAGGFYRIEPKGYVCVGVSASLDLNHPVAKAAATRPDRSAGLPYVYGMSKFPTPPFYLKIPTKAEQKSVEADLDKHLSQPSTSFPIADPLTELSPIPESLIDGKIVPSVTPNHHGPGALFAGRAVPKSGYALVSEFEAEGRRWGLTTDLLIVPLDRLKRLAPSDFHGVPLEGALPVVFVKSKSEHFYRQDETSGGFTIDEPISYRQAIPLTGQSKRTGKTTFWETRDGRWVRQLDDGRFLKIDPPKEWPSWATPNRRWLEISILNQTLVAYDGQVPAYATLVSTGADGLGDPEKTHSTVRGAFLIHTKHVTATMDNDEADDRFDLRDIPYVQYFHKGYAIHAAYWHDGFGTPRSHGCINVHPTDAAWLFGFTDPPVPDGWHGALSLKNGTLVYIRP
jgi:hypothetical protein